MLMAAMPPPDCWAAGPAVQRPLCNHRVLLELSQVVRHMCLESWLQVDARRGPRIIIAILVAKNSNQKCFILLGLGM